MSSRQTAGARGDFERLESVRRTWIGPIHLSTIQKRSTRRSSQTLSGQSELRSCPPKDRFTELLVYRNSVGDATYPVAPEGKPKNWLANEIILTVSPDSK